MKKITWTRIFVSNVQYAAQKKGKNSVDRGIANNFNIKESSFSPLHTIDIDTSETVTMKISISPLRNREKILNENDE